MKKQMFIYISNFAEYFLSAQRTLSWLLSPLSFLSSLVSRPVSRLTICFLPHFSHLPSPGSRLMSTASCLPSPFSLHLSPVYYLLSPCFMSPVSQILSHVFCLMSPVSRLPCCNCCRHNLQYNHLVDLTISWSNLADFWILAILTLLALLADYNNFF